MSTVTFDTLKFVETLKKSGFDDDKAKAIANAYQDASEDQEVVTKTTLQLELAPIRTELQILKWMSGLIMAGVFAIILKSFF